MRLDLGLLFLRVAASSMLLSHGIPKLLSFSANYATFADPLHVTPPVSLALTIFAEVFCSTAVLVGFMTQWAAIPVAFSMFVAASIVHIEDPWSKKEFALMYFICFATLAITGGGNFSMNRLIGKK
jgi:putative oxidoreductase